MYAVLTLAVLQELETLLYHGVFQHDHVLGHVLQQGEETTLGVEPCVRPQLHMHARTHTKSKDFYTQFSTQR